MRNVFVVDCVSPDCGQAGLMVWSSLEPNVATHVFNSHIPNRQLQYSCNQKDGDVVTVTNNASVDVPCLWLLIVREGDVIHTDVACTSETNNIEDNCFLDPNCASIDESDQTSVDVEIPMMESVALCGIGSNFI
eukprot:scaffold7518_cov32-Attheya_sp.AAC.3